MSASWTTTSHPKHNDEATRSPHSDGVDSADGYRERAPAIAANDSTADSTPDPESMPGAIADASNSHVGPRPQLAEPRRGRERRVLPTRHRKSLLVGSTLEEELLHQERASLPYFYSPSTLIVLSSDPSVAQHATRLSETGGLQNDVTRSFFADPEVAHACREVALVETPDFRLRDETELMGKTRGLTANPEDTSDTAYERRHRRPENMEKKQRRQEKDQLVRERQKLKDRIEQLKSADARLLMPIVTSRERRRLSATSAPNARGSEAALGLGKQNLTPHATATLSKLEALRTELLGEAAATLARYDALLASIPQTAGAQGISRKRTHANATDDSAAENSDTSGLSKKTSANSAQTPGHHSLAQTSKRSPRIVVRLPVSQRRIHPSGKTAEQFASRALAKRHGSVSSSHSHGAALVTTSPLSRARSTSSGVSPHKPRISCDPGGIRAEVGQPNIHARASTGRFAPKNSIVKETGRPATTEPRKRQPRALSAHIGRSRGASRASDLSHHSRAAEAGSSLVWPFESGSPTVISRYASGYKHPVLKTHTNKIAPSLAEIWAHERRPKRVRLIMSSANTSTSAGPNDTPSAAIDGTAITSMFADSTPPASSQSGRSTPTSTNYAPQALSMEEAQALLDRAMAVAENDVAAGEEAQLNVNTAAASLEVPAQEVVGRGTTAAEEDQDPSTRALRLVEAENPAPSSLPPLPLTSAPSELSALTSPTQLTTPMARPIPARHMPGRTAEARSRAAAAIPSRRASSRMKAVSAFGERIPDYVSRSLDFDQCFLEVALGAHVAEPWRHDLRERLSVTTRHAEGGTIKMEDLAPSFSL